MMLDFIIYYRPFNIGKITPVIFGYTLAINGNLHSEERCFSYLDLYCRDPVLILNETIRYLFRSFESLKERAIKEPLPTGDESLDDDAKIIRDLGGTVAGDIDTLLRHLICDRDMSGSLRQAASSLLAKYVFEKQLEDNYTTLCDRPKSAQASIIRRCWT